MRINVAVPEPHVSAPILNAALESVTRLDQSLIKQGAVPPLDEVIHRIRWKPEPPGQEHFDHAGVVLRRKWGDCDDIGPYHAASLRATGEDRGARAIVRKSGPKRWHVVVRRSDGSIDDPSIDAGMPAPGRQVGIRGAAQPRMTRPSSVVGAYVNLPELAMRRIPSLRGEPEAWQARTDLPWHYRPGKSPTDIAMVSLHRSPISDQALVGAVKGALRLGEAAGFADEYSLDRLAAIQDMCEGATYEDIEDEYGREHADAAAHVVGSFFGKIFKTVKKVATPVVKAVTSPIARKAIQFIPGVGPVASSALDVASPALRAMVSKGQHLPPAQRPAYQAALSRVPQVPRPGMARRAAPHRHAMFFSGPPIPL